MLKQNESKNGPTHDEIARRAYAIFEQNGRKPGHDLENWLEAEGQLHAARKQAQTRASNNVPARPTTRAVMNHLS